MTSERQERLKREQGEFFKYSQERGANALDGMMAIDSDLDKIGRLEKEVADYEAKHGVLRKEEFREYLRMSPEDQEKNRERKDMWLIKYFRLDVLDFNVSHTIMMHNSRPSYQDMQRSIDF